MVSPLSERSCTLLRQAGYCVFFRTQAWSECLVSHHDERWLGRGITDDDSLDDALRQMLPSHCARQLFYAQLADPAEVPASAQSSEPVAATPVLEAPLSAEIPGAVEVAEEAQPEPQVEATPLADAAATPAPELEQAPAEPTKIAAHDAAPRPRGAEVEPAPKGISLAEALTALEGMLREIDEQLPALAKKSAERQRLYLLAWICGARAFEEALPDARPVIFAVQRIARRLSEIGKMLWPGSVRALQIATTPADTMEPYSADQPPTTWAEAAERAALRLREHIAKGTAAGHDEDGWVDAALGASGPPEPDGLLAQAVAELDALLAHAGDAVPTDQDLAPLVRIAQNLRWIRGSVRDNLAWGLAMGRLRRFSLSLGNHGVVLRRTIDPAFRPPSWAPPAAPPVESAQPKESTADLLAVLADVGSGADTLLPWLIRAFDVFPTPALAEVLRSRRDQVAALAEIAATYEDRRIRRRLRDLIQRLAASGADEAPPSARRNSTAPSEEEAEPESADDSALRRLCDSVRPHTQGRRVLFASNRPDDRLEARLTELLGVRMSGCDGAPRRVQSQCERIAQGSYDLVLSATGFQDHAVDGVLARAASSAGIPYVRVNRGRPLACAQAIARELGHAGENGSQAPSRPAA